LYCMIVIENYPVFIQRTDYDCGLVAIKQLLEYHGINKTYSELKRALKTNPSSGTCMDRMRTVIPKMGLSVFIGEMTVLEVCSNIPVVTPIKSINSGEGHYVTAIGYDNSNLYIQDPAFEKPYLINKKSFLSVWYDEDDNKSYVNYGIYIEKR
jgi:predicted double-glycine peptidase